MVTKITITDGRIFNGIFKGCMNRNIVISTTYWLFNVTVHATRENSVPRESRQQYRHCCGLGFATAAIWAEIAVAEMALSAENSWQILQSL